MVPKESGFNQSVAASGMCVRKAWRFPGSIPTMRDGKLVQIPHSCHHVEKICHPNSSYVTTKLDGTSTGGCNNNTIFSKRAILTFLTVDVCRAVGPCTGLKFRPRPGPQIWFEAQARKLNYEARPAQLCPGPVRNTIVIFETQGLRAGPLTRPHTTKTAILLMCTCILMSCDCLVVMFTITCISNVCVKSSMDKKYA